MKLLFGFVGIFLLAIGFIGGYLSKSIPVKDVSPLVRVKEFYDLYASKDFGGRNPMATPIARLEKMGYITSETIQRITPKSESGADPVLCTQGGSSAPIRVGEAVISSERATVTVKQYYPLSKLDNIIKVTVGLPENKIIDIQCVR